MKHCPLCSIMLRPVSLSDGLELDFCVRCKGIWFDHKELDRASGSKEHRTMLLNISSAMPSQIQCKVCSQVNPRLTMRCTACEADLRPSCPECQERLDQTSIEGVVTDRCPRCHGVWLDGGELGLLFAEFQKQRARQGAHDSTNVAAAVADVTLETLIWAPHLVYHAGSAAAKVATEIPGVLAHGADAAIQAASHLPEFASGAAQGAVEVAGHVAELSGDVIQSAAQIVSNIPDAAGSVADLFGSFIEFLIGLISD